MYKIELHNSLSNALSFAFFLLLSFHVSGQANVINLKGESVPTNYAKNKQSNTYQLSVKRNYFKPNNSNDFSNEMIILELEIGEYHFILDLFEDDLIAPELLSELETKGIKVPITYEGYTQSGKKTRITINDDFIYGYIQHEDETLYIEPASYTNKKASKKAFLLYEGDEAAAHMHDEGEHFCGLHHQKGPTKSIKDHVENMPQNQMACRGLKIAIASDHTMWSAYGTEQAVNDHNIGVLNNVQGDYDGVGSGAFDIEFQLIAQYNAQSHSANPYTTTGADAGALLSEFTSWSVNGGFGTAATPHLQGGRTASGLAMLWTNKDITYTDNNGTVQSGVVGLAYQPGNHSLLEDFGGVNTTGSGYGLRVLQSHEMGHNLGYGHDDSSSCGNGSCIMWPSVQNTSTWSGASITAINSNLNGRTLSGCTASCSNGQQDLGELGIDCGGVCEACACDASDTYSSPLSLSISFDGYAEESSWDIRSSADVVLHNASYGTSQRNNSVTVNNITLDDANGFTFTFYDSYGDGMCCTYGNGSFTLTDANGQVIYTGGSFSNSTAKTFCISSVNLCSNGQLDPGEEAIDCGGTCSSCIVGCMDNSAHNFNPNAQVDSESCETCNDGINNGDEVGIDCGGSLCTPCEEGCNDGIQNGDETGIDCGGPSCPPCPCDDDMVDSDAIVNADKTERAKIRITSSAKIMNGVNLEFLAGTEIILEANFEVNASGTFVANIEDCEN